MIHTINTDKCTGCGTCMKTCALDVFRIDVCQPSLSPCQAACPAGTDVRAYNALMQQGRRHEAARKLRERNPFPAVTGRVCSHPCENKCSRAPVDGAVNINAVEQYLGDLSLEDMPEKPEVRHLARVAVAGSGPAGLACAWFLARAGYPVTVFEALPQPGGMLRWGIPAYRLPSAVIRKQVEQLKALGVTFVCNTRVGEKGDVSLDDLRKRGFRAVFLAPGASRSRRAGIPGEDAPGVLHGLEFLRQARSEPDDGVPSLGAIRPGARVVVVGGGDVAMDAAITAKKLGAGEVAVVCLEGEGEMPAFPHNVEDARACGVSIQPGWGPAEVCLEGGRAGGLKVKRCVSVFDGDHAFRPVFDEAETRVIPADAVIFAIGQQADLTPFPQLDRAAPTRISVDPVTMGTSLWNVFAGGDAVTGPRSVIEAIAAGREAAISIDRLLRGCNVHSDREETRSVPENLPGEGVLLSPRNGRPRRDSEGFGETRQGLDDLAALDESMRCLTCGAKARIAYRDDCMTCYFCELRCPSSAIDVHPYKERLPFIIERNAHAF